MIKARSTNCPANVKKVRGRQRISCGLQGKLGRKQTITQQLWGLLLIQKNRSRRSRIGEPDFSSELRKWRFTGEGTHSMDKRILHGNTFGF